MATRPARIAEGLHSEPSRGAWPGDRLRNHLAELAAGLDERFLRGGNLLSDAITTIKTLLTGLDDMNGALDADGASRAVAQLRRAATQISQLPETMRHRDADLAKVAGLVREVEGHVADIRRQLQIIGIYGMNIRIAGAGGDFRIFVDDMAGRLSAGEAEIDIFAQRLVGIVQSAAPVRKAYAEVLSAQSGMSGEVHQLIDDCSAQLERHLAGAGALAGQLHTLAARVQDSVGGVLAAIQVADSTRQRIEHVVEAFDIVADEARTGGMPSGARDHLAGLIGSLIDSAEQDHARQAHELTQSLARLAAVSGDLAGLVDRRAEGDGTQSLNALESGIAAITEMTNRLGETAVRADTMGACIADATDDLTGRLDSIDQIVRDVKAIAINTRLLCLRHGQTGVAVAVIAVEVAAQATQLKETAGLVAEAIDRLAGLNKDLRIEMERHEADLGAMLEKERAVIAAACRQSDAALADGGVVVQRLMRQLDDASAVVGDKDQLTQTLKQATAALAGPVAILDDLDESCLRRVLPMIGARYTMAAERQVHARFALAEGSFGHDDSSPPLANVVIEQDEDGLF